MARITIKNIAEATNLSVPTVAQILGNRGHLFREETRLKVLEAARRLGYRPNRAAKAMRSGSLGAVLLLNSSPKSYECLYPGMFRALAEELSLHGKHLTMAHLPNVPGNGSSTLPNLLTDYYADGLLLHYDSDYPPLLKQAVERHSIPVGWLNVRKGADAVFADFENAGRQAIELLQSHGHRRVAFLGISQDCEPRYSIPDALQGVDSASNYPHQPHLLTMGQIQHSEVDAKVAAILGGPEAPTALIVVGELLALAVYMACLRLGVSVPGQVSLVALADRPLAAPAPELTHFHVDGEEMGRCGIRMLLEKIAKPEVELPAIALPLHFKAGSSVAPPAA